VLGQAPGQVFGQAERQVLGLVEILSFKFRTGVCVLALVTRA